MSARDILGAIGAALLVLWIVLHLASCSLFASAPAVVDLAAYKLALDTCRAEGKAARSYAVYEACAVEADKRHGLKDGGAP